jgi:hypothetical protein
MSTEEFTNEHMPSNFKFGSFFAFLFALLSAYAYWSKWSIVLGVALFSAVLFALATIIAPQALAPLNRIWFGIGLLLGKIVSPIVLGIIFFLLISPASIVARLFGRDELKLKKRNLDSYWVVREPPGPATDSFKNQY